jgi:hypothetical protein
MELLIVLGGFIALALLAPWLGHDTRERLISQEERFASNGFAWGPGEQVPVGPIFMPRRWIRGHRVSAASSTRPALPTVLSWERGGE